MLLTYAASVIGLGLLATYLLKFSGEGYSSLHAMAFLSGLVSCIVCLIGLIFGLVLSYNWYSAKHKAKIINREYNTNYTQEEIFYAEDVIETIREIKRQRNEVKVEIK